MKTTKTKDLRSSTMRFLIDNKAMLLALLALIAASVISPTFFSFQNLRNVIRQNTTYFVLAFGFTCVLSSGNIDLSVGLMTGMLGIFVGIMDVRMGLPLGVIIVLILLMGAFCGFMNGLIGKLIKMPMFIVTLATGQLYKGICYMISKNTPIINIRAGIKFMAQGYVFKEIPVAILIMLNKTIFGRWAVAMGGNPETARVSGINTFWVTSGVYALMGVCCAVAALVLTGRAGSAQPTAGDGMEMDAIAAVIIGGTSMSGGRGSVIGSVLGMLILAVMNNLLNLIGVPPFLREAFKGIIVIGAVLLQKKEKAS